MTLDEMIRAIVREELDRRFPPPTFEELNPAPKGEHLRGEKLPPNGTEIGSLPPPIKFDDVKAAFIAMVKRTPGDTGPGQALLDKFGLKLLSAAKPEQYADIIKACA